MLALITHEPNIIILREEVFGNKKKKVSDPNQRQTIKKLENFEIFYISILREYLELEFLEIKSKLKFEFNIERIIDDFIFFCFFIGNDFLPNLNTVDIENGSLNNIFFYYKEILPSLDDYITYHGKIDFKKAEKIFSKLATHELASLKEMLLKINKENANFNIKKQQKYEAKKDIRKRMKINNKKENFLLDLKKNDEMTIVKYKKNKISNKLSNFQKSYEEEIKSRGGTNFKFKEDISKYLQDQLRENINNINYGQNLSEENPSKTESSQESSALENKEMQLKMDKGLCSLFDSEDEKDKKSQNAKEKHFYQKPAVIDKLNEILKSASRYHRYVEDDKYCSDINVDDIDDEDIGNVTDPFVSNDEEHSLHTKDYMERQDMDLLFQQKLVNYYVNDVNQAKAFYYKEKVHIDLETEEGKKEHKNMFNKYLEGLQWVLYYYYRGVKSWRWYYPYHYAPMISDFEKMKDMLDYEIDENLLPSQPYTPFQSLLFILPRKSKNLVPSCFWSIYEELPHYYPEKFGIDFNGKKMDWEAIVLLPFVPEEPIIEFEERIRTKCLDAQKKGENNQHKLTSKDLSRNEFGNSYIYSFDKTS